MELGSVSKGNLLDMESPISSRRNPSRSGAVEHRIELVVTHTIALSWIPPKGSPLFHRKFPLRPWMPMPWTRKWFPLHSLISPTSKLPNTNFAAAEKDYRFPRGALYPRLFASGNLSTNYSTSSKDFTQVVGPPSTVVSGFTSSGDTVYSLVPNVTTSFKDTLLESNLMTTLEVCRVYFAGSSV